MTKNALHDVFTFPVEIKDVSEATVDAKEYKELSYLFV